MNALQQFIASKPMGFLRDTDIAELIKLDRLCPVLVRCGGCRFTCGAQDVDHLEKCLRAGGDYIRDISFPVGSIDRAAKWQLEPDFAALNRAADAKLRVGVAIVTGGGE